MTELISLLNLQRDLKEAAAQLADRAERTADMFTLRLHTEIMDRCLRLDRDIAVLTSELLAAEMPEGSA